MYIEDLIDRVSTRVIWSSDIHPFNFREMQFLESVQAQLSRGNSLTEKQAHLSLIILSKSKHWMRDQISNIDEILDNPQWKYTFRKLTTEKRIFIDTFNNEKVILVEFPFDSILVDTFRKRNQGLHELYKGLWDGDKKAWIFGLTEKSIAWLGDILIPKNFEVDEEFLELYKFISEIHENIEQHIPMVTYKNNKFSLINAHKNIPELSTENLAEALFFARDHGINTWDDEIDSMINNLSVCTRSLLSSTAKQKNWFNSEQIPIFEFEDILKYGGPCLILIPGGSELELTKKWTEFALKIGINIEDISVMFRLPNEQASFNQYVKNIGLNNPIIDNTRIVFVSTKITKPLVKSNIKFNTAINLGYYNYLHFTMTTMVESVPNLIHYSLKEPTTARRWQPLEL